MFTPRQLATLATAYCAHTGDTLAALGRRAVGNPTLFVRLVAGRGCHADSAERASVWFRENWPEGLVWPLEGEKS